jgi:peptidoglycan/LPS O-acetylase OafA/YrhL
MQGERYHSFDSLRAAMMLLGIWMHGVQCYTQLDVYRWPFKDASRTQVFDFTINWVHIFRMPVFFAMAGFFFALLTVRRGPGGAIRNRLKRILLPFILAWVVLAPVLLVTIEYLRTGSWPDALALALEARNYWEVGPLHLWFLEYLLLLYPVMLALDWIVRRLFAGQVLSTASRMFDWTLTSPWRAPIAALATGWPMFLMGGWLTTPGGFLPTVRILGAYLLFFAFGWVLYLERDVLARMKRGGGIEMAAGAAIAVLGHAVLLGVLPQGLWRFAGPLATWLFLFGFIAVGQRCLDKPIPWVRYLSDASYWMYLIHVPLLIWIQMLIAPLALPALIKGLLALTLAAPLLIGSYHLAVRTTWIGAMLNGRRYPIRARCDTRLAAAGQRPVPIPVSVETREAADSRGLL